MNLPEGIHRIPVEQYHADDLAEEPSLSRSCMVDLLYRSPAHAYFGHPRLNSAAFDVGAEDKFNIGTAAHSLLLEGIDAAQVLDFDDYRKKDAQTERDAARAAGKIPLLREQYERVSAMVAAAHRQIAQCTELGIDDLASQGDGELTFLWHDKGTWLRSRPDWISRDRRLILDYKTTDASAAPEDFAKRVTGLGYDIQDAAYSRGVMALQEVDCEFVFAVQEVREPYLMSFVSLPPDWKDIGRQKVDEAIFRWEQCRASGRWPGFPSRICYLDMPGWVMTQFEERRHQPVAEPDKRNAPLSAEDWVSA